MKKKVMLLSLILTTFNVHAVQPNGEIRGKKTSNHFSRFYCSQYVPAKRQVLKPKSCDDTGGFNLLTKEYETRPELKKIFESKTEAEIEKNQELKDKALEVKFSLTSNMNAATFTFPNGVTRKVFRGSYQAPMFTEDSILKKGKHERDEKVACMKDLVKKHKLSKIVNYDELDWDSAKKLTKNEKKLLLELNPKAKYWMYNDAYKKTFQYKFKKGEGATAEEKKADVMNNVANIIREIQGNPNEPGSVYIHCYGGHHRTGAVYGVLQKCMGKMNVDDIINEYKCHIGYESADQPGGYNADNEALIREFPCEKYFAP